MHSPDYNPMVPLGWVNVFNPHGWTISVHHFYDPNQRKIYLGDGSIQKINKAKDSGGNHVVVSPSGDEVYVFGPDGRHLETRYALTGAIKFTFTYSGNDRLEKVEDSFGNETLLNQDSSGSLISITAPYGQITFITRNGANLINSVENPNGEKFELTYKSGTSLLETFKKPGGQISTFSYDSDGRLIKDEGPGGNYLSFASSGLPGDPIVQTSKMGREVSIEIGDQDESYVRKEILPPGEEVIYAQGYYTGTINQISGWWQTTISRTEDERLGKYFDRILKAVVKTNGNESTTDYDQTVIYPPNVAHDFFNFQSGVDPVEPDRSAGSVC